MRKPLQHTSVPTSAFGYTNMCRWDLFCFLCSLNENRIGKCIFAMKFEWMNVVNVKPFRFQEKKKRKREKECKFLALAISS